MKRKVAILGSTGSIGESALRVVRALPAELEIVGLAVSGQHSRLIEQALEFGVRTVAVADPAAAADCRRRAPDGIRVLEGSRGVAELAVETGADVMLCSVVGMAGLQPVLSSMEAGIDVALATKEVLVAAGGIVDEVRRRRNVELLPVDSEHSAIFQCLCGACDDSRISMNVVRRIVLTASGGPFAAQVGVDFSKVTVADALNHPRWDMGQKVTVDSATMMNKGLEIMEAHWLFGVPVDRIDVVVHPESIVHSLVEFIDGNLLAQLGVTDMRLAIQHALTWPRRLDGGLPRLDLTRLAGLHFAKPDPQRFPCLRLAREAAIQGGTLPAVLNAANEVAVEAFLGRQIGFSGIWETVERVMDRHESVDTPALDDIVRADAWARQEALHVASQSNR